MSVPAVSSTEVIVFASGKGGTGKTSLAAALGYALTFSGHKVLMVDTDRATNGFSLFVLGPEGMKQLDEIKPENTFSGFLEVFEETERIGVEPFTVNRSEESDHGLLYSAIISDRNLYGDLTPPTFRTELNSQVKQANRQVFQRAIYGLLNELRERRAYDYILVDTRGGFSFESTDVAAAGDSFVVVTEASYTTFYQDRNLVARIVEAADQIGSKAVLRGIIVNKSTEEGELPFRNELTREFGVRLDDTWPIALDVAATSAYKNQRVIFRESPASRFCYDSLQAFKQILRIVTRQWSEGRAKRWNELVATVDRAIAEKNKQIQAEKETAQRQLAYYEQLEKERDKLQSELGLLREVHEQEKRRQDIVFEELKSRGGELAGQKQRRGKIYLIALFVLLGMLGAVSTFFAYYAVNRQRSEIAAIQNELKARQSIQTSTASIFGTADLLPGNWVYYGNRDVDTGKWENVFFNNKSGDSKSPPRVNDLVVPTRVAFVRQFPIQDIDSGSFDKKDTSSVVTPDELLKVADVKSLPVRDQPYQVCIWIRFLPVAEAPTPQGTPSASPK